MILECPACHARFKVADNAIPPEGRTVKCGRCTHQWHVVAPVTDDAPISQTITPPAEDILEQAARAVEVAEAIVAAAPPVIEPIPEPIHAAKPVPLKPAAPKPIAIPIKPFMIAVPSLAALWIILLVMAHYPTWIDAPVVGPLYKMVGVHTTEGITFEDVTMQPQKIEGRTKYILSGSIANHSAADRTVPSVRVILKDAEGKKLWSHEYVVNERLKGGEVYPFRIDNVVTSFGDKVTSIVVDVGHKLQLMMR